MREHGAGSIVNISSIAALAAATRLTAYKLSKAAINALSQSPAQCRARHPRQHDHARLARHADGGVVSSAMTHTGSRPEPRAEVRATYRFESTNCRPKDWPVRRASGDSNARETRPGTCFTTDGSAPERCSAAYRPARGFAASGCKCGWPAVDPPARVWGSPSPRSWSDSEPPARGCRW